ncbi:MAG: GYD domain-containing protein [Candidatus Omnitrophica bacterium]|nr:GYD domain-containing protein [Candidatus Omnitrophota bacterium]
MAKYMMLGKYSSEAVRGIKAERTKKVAAIIKRNGGKVIGMYALIGPYDLAFIVDMPSNAALIKTAIAMTRMTGIGFFSLPAMSVDEFDRTVG